MGTSLVYRQPVAKVIAVKLGNSLFLMGLAWIISGLLGFLLGVLAGVFKGKPIDKAIKGYSLVIASTPAFWLALLLLIVFGVWLRVLPIGLSVPIGVEASGVTFLDRVRHAILPAAFWLALLLLIVFGVWLRVLPIGLSVPIGVEASGVTFLDRVRHAILPALTLSITGISNIALHTREKMIDIMESDYVLFARARGESIWSIVRHHGLRNVLLPAMTLQFASISEIIGGSVLVEQVFSYPGLGQAAVSAGTGSDVPLLMGITLILQFASISEIIGGSVLVEQVFSYPGLGQAAVSAGTGSDVPLLMGITLITAAIVFLGNFIANLLYGTVDPRIRKGGAR